MIKLTDVSKTYVSKKSKQKVDALRGVSFELADTGMVFILGKSGSGKSTLLNMLGGLDKPTNGDIIVDGVSMKDFKQADYEGYRNGYVGFIFQEFNLLNEFNVKDNIALALHLSKGDNIDERVLKALQEVELNEDYLTRRVDEMSGGEKQRVAIARTIVKDSKMILADEPTGNLDEATGESIWNILKELSKTRLVVVVSHDRDSATKYGDRVIEIADGKIIADNGKQIEANSTHPTFTPQPKRLTFSTCVKMAFNSLSQRKVRSVCVMLLSILSIFAIIMTQICLSYSAQIAVAKFIRDYDVDYFVITDQRVPRNEDKAFLDGNCAYIQYDRNASVVNGKQDIVDMGFSFVGEAMELDFGSFYITSNAFEEIERNIDYANSHNSSYYYYLDDNGDKVYITEKPDSWEFLIGKRMDRTLLSSSDEFLVVAGIVDFSNVSDYIVSYLPKYFILNGFNNSSYPGSNVTLNEIDGLLDFGGGKQYSGATNISLSYSMDRIVTESGIVNPRNLTVGDGEIVISYDMLAALFNVKSATDYVQLVRGEYILQEIPEQVGQTHRLVLYDELGEQIVDFGELKIIGVSLDFFNYYDYEVERNLYCQVNRKTFSDYYYKTQRQFIVSTASVNNIIRYVTTLNKSHCTSITGAGFINYTDIEKDIECVDIADEVTKNMEFFTIIVASVSGVMTLILILLVANLISLSIVGRKKEIGILSALGTSNKDITKIFIIETLIISVITFVMALIASFVFVAVINNYFSVKYFALELVLSLFGMDILTGVTLIVASFGLLLLGALLPLLKLSKLKPIDAIRNN